MWPCLPSPLTTSAQQRASFSHSAAKSIKAVIQRRGKGVKKFGGKKGESSACWLAGWLTDCVRQQQQQRRQTATCHTAGISSHNKKGGKSRHSLFLPACLRSRRGFFVCFCCCLFLFCFLRRELFIIIICFSHSSLDVDRQSEITRASSRAPRSALIRLIWAAD